MSKCKLKSGFFRILLPVSDGLLARRVVGNAGHVALRGEVDETA